MAEPDEGQGAHGSGVDGIREDGEGRHESGLSVFTVATKFVDGGSVDE